MSESKARVVDAKPEINQKLGNVKFDQVFDGTSIQKAEQAFDKKKDDFRESVIETFTELTKVFDGIDSQQEPSEELVKKISDVVSLLKSKGTTGGFPLITEVAKSLYEYCDQNSNKLTAGQFKVVLIHYKALDQILSQSFDVENEEKAAKLLAGLHELSAKNL